MHHLRCTLGCLCQRLSTFVVLLRRYLDQRSNASFSMPALLDVQGFSHVNDTIFTNYHKVLPCSRPSCCHVLHSAQFSLLLI